MLKLKYITHTILYSKNAKFYLGLAAIILGVIIIYANAITAGFVYDDKNFILNNKPIKTWLFSNPWDFFLKPEVSVWSGIYRPLRTLSFAIDYQLFGINPIGYRIENIFLHIINCWLVFVILSKLLSSKTKTFIASAIFAIHPLQIESVTWISSRGDLMFAFFTLICFHWFLRYPRGFTLKQTLLWNILYFIGLLSKETAIGLLPVVLFYDIMFNFKRMQNQSLKSFIKSRWLFYMTVFFVSAGYIFMRFSLFENVSQKPYWGGSAYSNLLTMLDATVYYFRLIFYPTDLSIDYSTYPIVYSLKNPSIWVAGLFYLSCLLILVIEIRRNNWKPLFFCLFFVFFLLPSWNIFPISAIIAERFLYLPLAGFCALSGSALGYIYDGFGGIRLRRLSLCLTAVILSLLSVLSVYRNRDWESDLSLWKSCVEEFPGNFKGHINLGTCYEDMDEPYKAMDEYYKLIAYQKHHAMAYYNLANIYWDFGLFDKSEQSFLSALKYDPKYWEALNNLGSLYVDKAWYRKAEHCFLKVIAGNPNYAKAHFNIGSLYYSYYKDYKKAQYHFMKCLEDEEFKDSSKIYSMLADIQMRLREANK